MNRYRTLVLTAIMLGAVTAACSSTPVPDDTSDDTVPNEPGPAESPAKKDDPAPAGGPKVPDQKTAACPYDGPPVDVSGFATCGDGGRCIPSAVIPKDQQSRLATCAGGFCVPEKIIKAQGNLLPKTCKSIAGGEGRCTSTVFPDIDKQKASLPQDNCDANERCAPCFNPLDGKETGACSTVTCDAPKTKGAAFPSCCTSGGKSRGRCVPTASLPAEAVSGLDQKECDAASLCAPAENFDDKFVPPKCTASALLGKYDGACVSTCVKSDFLTSLGTAQGTCDSEHFCAPCKNPLTGAPTGAPGCAP